MYIPYYKGVENFEARVSHHFILYANKVHSFDSTKRHLMLHSQPFALVIRHIKYQAFPPLYFFSSFVK